MRHDIMVHCSRQSCVCQFRVFQLCPSQFFCQLRLRQLYQLCSRQLFVGCARVRCLSVVCQLCPLCPRCCIDGSREAWYWSLCGDTTIYRPSQKRSCFCACLKSVCIEACKGGIGGQNARRLAGGWRRYFLDFCPKKSSQTQESCFLLSVYPAWTASSSEAVLWEDLPDTWFRLSHNFNTGL